ncbi:MAG: TadE/TadG family type IV pilus assembly protein [Gemmatimonadales bacterium]
MSLMVSHLRGRKGQALAEFALILPVVFLLIAGIIEFGRAWNIKQAVTDAAREGARYTVVVDTTSQAGIKHRIKQRLALASIDTTNPPTNITISPIASLHCAGGVGAGADMTVNITTTYRMGWVGAILHWTGGSSTITISSKATMRNEC